MSIAEKFALGGGGMPSPADYVSDVKTLYVTASGTITFPADVQSMDGFPLAVDFVFQAPGASGAKNSANPNGGGTGGAWKIRYNWPLPANRQVGVTMGAPGAAVVVNAGGNSGGDCYWDTAGENLLIEGGHGGGVNNDNYNIPGQPSGHDSLDFQGLMFFDGKSIDGWPGGSVRIASNIDSTFAFGGRSGPHKGGRNDTATRTHAAGGASLLSPGGDADQSTPTGGHSWGAGTGASESGSSRTAGPGIVIVRYRSLTTASIA